MSRLNDVLRASPNATVAVCITDEFTVDTPRQRFKAPQAEVLHHIITQATPQALVQATTGTGSWLRALMGDASITPPRRIHRLIERRSFNEAQLAAVQFCQLALMTTTPFRAHVRRELTALMPRALEVHFVRSRRVTFASLLARRQADVVPADLCNVLLQYLAPLRMTAEEREGLCAALFASGGPATLAPADLAAAVRAVDVSRATLREDRGLVERLVERLDEFARECPVCMSDGAAGMRLCARCGHVVCAACHEAACRATGRARCAFCRADLPDALPRAQAASAGWALPPRAASADGADDAPPPPPEEEEGAPPSLEEALARHATPARSQRDNLAHALHALRARGLPPRRSSSSRRAT